MQAADELCHGLVRHICGNGARRVGFTDDRPR